MSKIEIAILIAMILALTSFYFCIAHFIAVPGMRAEVEWMEGGFNE